MSSKKLSIFVIFCVFLLTISLSAVSGVDIQANASNSQIQSAIDSASNGDTINFLGDKYDNISLFVNNKSLKFQGKNKTTLSLEKGGMSLINLINANGTSFSGFNFFSASHTQGTYLIYSTGNTKDISITKNDFSGSCIQISLYNAINCTIDSNNFYESSDISIELGRNMGINGGTLGNNTISNNKFINIGYDVIQTSMENTSIFGNLISNYGLKLPESGMASMFNGGIGIFFTKEFSYGTVYDNIFQNGDIAIKHGKYPPVDLLLEIYGNKIINHTTGIIYNTKGDVKNYNNAFTNVGKAIVLTTGLNVLKLSDNNYTNVGTPIVMDGNFGADPSKSPANIVITGNVTANSVNINGQVMYTVKIHNSGDLVANKVNVLIPNSLFNGVTTTSTILSAGNYSNGVWSVDSLASDGDALIVFVLKGKTAGSYKFSTTAKYQSGENVNILSSSSSQASLTIKKVTTTPLKPAKITYSVKNKVQGKKVTKTFTIKNSGGKTGTISTTLKIPSNLKYLKTVVGKYASFKYTANKKSLYLKVTNLPKSKTTVITIYFNKK